MSFDLNLYLDELRQQLDQALRDFLPRAQGEDYLKLREAMANSLLDGGKRLRPCLVLAASEAVGGDRRQALASACALEMIHAYSLVHDDLPAMDDDDMRRGQPTCHKQYGQAAAILTGDALLTLAFEVIAADGAGQPQRTPALLAASLELARAAGSAGMVGGQAMDMVLKDTPPSFDVLENCHAMKTAALFAGSAAVGALVGGAAAEQVNALRTYGLDLGLAFQHADDLLDSDFPEFQQQSLARCIELNHHAASLARNFGEAGVPLVELTKLVERRAKEAFAQ